MKNTLLTFLTLSLLASCALKELAAKNLDTFLYFKITNVLDLYSRQKDDLSKDIGAFLNNQKILVSDIKKLVVEFDLKKSSKLPQDVGHIFLYYNEISKGLTPLIAQYLSILDPKQQLELFKNLGEQNSEQKEKLKEFTDKQHNERGEYFFGSVTDEQKVVFQKYHQVFFDHSKQRLESKLILQGKIKEVLASVITSSEKKAQLITLFLEYQKNAFVKQETLTAFLQEVGKTLSEEQATFFKNKKQDVVEILGFFEKTKY